MTENFKLECKEFANENRLGRIKQYRNSYNLFRPDTFNQSIIRSSGGTITVNGTGGSQRVMGYITIPAGSYYFSTTMVSGRIGNIQFILSNHNYGGGRGSFTASEPLNQVPFYINVPYGTYDNVSFKIMFNEGPSAKEYEAYGSQVLDTLIDSSDYLQKIEIQDDCIVNGNINGTVSSKTCKFASLENLETIGDVYYPQIGVKYADTTTEYIDMGKYTIQKPTNEKTAEMSEFEGIDDLCNLNEKYVCGIEDFTNKTIKDLLLDICEQSDLELGTQSFTNDDIPIEGNPFVNGETRRDVLSAILNVTLNFADVDIETNELNLRWLDSTVSETFTKDDYSSLEKNNVYGPINCLVIRMSELEGENVIRQDSQSIATNGENQFIIQDDYFLITEELREQYIDDLWDKINGLTYVDCKMTTYLGRPYLQKGNKISIQDTDDSYFDTYVLKHNFVYDGSFTSTIESPALTKQEEKVKNIQSIKDFRKRTEAVIDKVNQNINFLVTETESLNDTVTEIGTTYQQSLNDFQYQITQLNETISESNEELQDQIDNLGGIPEQLKNTLVTININGITVATNLSKVSTIVTNNTFAVQDNYGNYLTYIGYDETEGRSKAEMDNLTVTNFFTAGVHRQQKFEPTSGDVRTGWFYIGG